MLSVFGPSQECRILADTVEKLVFFVAITILEAAGGI